MVRREKIEKLVEIIRPYPTEYLYKYRTMQSKELEEIFSKRQVYLSDPTKFNDPFECRPVLTFHKSSIKRERYLKRLAKERFPTADKRAIKKLMKGKKPMLTDMDHLKTVYRTFISNNAVYSLSEKNDDLLMWSHYSDSHRGLCIEFDASKKGSLFWEALKVIYQNDYPTVNVMGLGEGEPEEFRKALLAKSNHWKYEEERRVLKDERDGGPGMYTFPSELLTGVIFGALMPAKDKEILMNWIGDYPTNIKKYQSVINDKRYQLDIVPI
ncbi:DUF2971 domain-containing protein [bacterium]|jgi:hypothetical protein|nr:DUF2971 domain-containing protein [bacterium]